MELQLELALSSSFDSAQSRKRSFDDAFPVVKDVPRTLPLFIWNEYEEEEQKQIQNLPISNRNGNVENEIAVGWPPVKSWRKQFCQQNRRGSAANYVNVENAAAAATGGRGSNSTYVKVKMEGVGIARKVNLRNHSSYQTLIASLIALFGQCEENAEMYKLTYQDKEGDWLLAGDVPWETFIRSVGRLKLQKNGY